MWCLGHEVSGVSRLQRTSLQSTGALALARFSQRCLYLSLRRGGHSSFCGRPCGPVGSFGGGFSRARGCSGQEFRCWFRESSGF